MKIFEFTCGDINNAATLVHAGTDDRASLTFDVNGTPLHWTRRPAVKVFIAPRRKKAKPRVDVSELASGAVVLSEKARSALGDFLSRFGQLLELDCEGHAEYFYNVTNVVDCIDLDRSTLRSSGSIEAEAFFPDRLPQEPSVFKDPRKARTRIYVNQGAKNILDELIRGAGITGAEFIEIRPPA